MTQLKEFQPSEIIIMQSIHLQLKCYCLRKPGDMAKSRNMKVVQIYSFLVW